MDCLICEKSMITTGLKCKMCGMSIHEKQHYYNNYIFCSKKCRQIFDVIVKINGMQSELVQRDVII